MRADCCDSEARRLFVVFQAVAKCLEQPMGTNSYSSSLRNGGKPLRLAYPIYGRNTFRPSGDPQADPPERAGESALARTPRILGIDTPEGVRLWDREIADSRGVEGLASKEQCAYWDRIRFLQSKTPRARKRAENRQRREEK
jgi:hypothetical protein